MKSPFIKNPIVASSSLKLFGIGATIGPLVDSLHNQSLLQYDRLPINVQNILITPSTSWESSSSSMPPIESIDNPHSYLFCSSWYIPLLLGIAYVVLGDWLPNSISTIISRANEKVTTPSIWDKKSSSYNIFDDDDQETLQRKALLAVSSTTFIIKLSDFLQTHPNLLSYTTTTTTTTLMNNGDLDSSMINFSIMTLAALTQWFVLDRRISSLITACLVGFGGPLSELPFIAGGFWHYIPSAADYSPLAQIQVLDNSFLEKYKDLVLSSITGPCYFAVTMDAIAFGRLFKKEEEI